MGGNKCTTTSTSVSFFPVKVSTYNPCYTGKCKEIIDSSCIAYTGATLNIINPSNNDIETIIKKINDILANLGDGVIDWNEINASCLGPITSLYDFIINTITSFCSLSETVETIDDTVSGNYSSLDGRIDALETPAITTCGTLGIAPTDSLQQVLNKLKTPICTLQTAVDITGITWNVCGFSVTDPTTIKNAFTTVLEMLCTLKNSIPDDVALPLFDNTDCLGGGAEDSLEVTIDLLKAKLCTLDFSFNPSLLSFQCVPSSNTLQATVQNIITTLSDLKKNSILEVDEHFLLEDVGVSGSCSGKRLTFIGNDSDEKVALNEEDTPGYLIEKIEGVSSLITVNVTPDSGVLKISASIDDNTFISYMLNKIKNTPELKSLFCSIECSIGVCAPSNLTLTNQTV